MFLGEKMNQMRKMQKNTKKEKKTQNIQIMPQAPEEEIRRFGLLVLIIVVVLFLVYIISGIVKGKDYSSIFDNGLDVSEIQYKEILIGTMLKQKEEKYQVVVIAKEDPYAEILKKYVQTYLDNEKHTALYTVDLDNLFNRSAKAEETDRDTLKFKSSALLLIENGKIESIEEDSAIIASTLTQMAKELEET